MAIVAEFGVRGRRFLSHAAALLLVVACSGGGERPSGLNGEQVASVERSVGFDGNIIRLGVIADLTGPASALDRARLTGVSAYWSDVNAQGGVGGRYSVELEILDHRGDPRIAEQYVPVLLNEVVALTFINETAMGAVHPFLVAEQVLGVAPTSTLDWESDPRFLTHVPPVEAMVLALFENASSSKWCVVTDGSPLGIAVRNSSMRAARIAGAKSVTLIEVEEDLNSAITAAACELVLAEVAERFQTKVVTSLPANRKIFRQAGLANTVMKRDDLQFAYVDAGPSWDVDSSVGMRPFLAALLRHAPDVQPDTRVRDGYVSQIRLHQLLEQAVVEGDLRRPSLFATNEAQEQINMLGLAEDLNVSAGQRSMPRNMNVRLASGGEESLDGRGWELERQLRAENFGALASELLG